MYSFRPLDAELLARFKGLTYPRYQKLFAAAALPDQVTAIGTLYFGQPVGLVFGAWSEDRQIGQVLSLYTVPAHRHKGIGTRLLVQGTCKVRERRKR